MASKSLRVRDLAVEAGMSVDDALIELWGYGVEYLESGNDLIRRQDIQRARRIVGLPTRRELTSINYWCNILNKSKPELSATLSELGIRVDRNSDKIPKGAIRKLRKLTQNPLITLTPDPQTVNENSKPRRQPFSLRQIGHRPTKPITYLSSSDIENIHSELTLMFANSDDPIEPPGVKDRCMLESAAFRPQTSSGESFKYETIELAAAALCHSITCNHAFHNGNKRTGMVSTLAFLYENNISIRCDENSLFKFIVRVAQHGFCMEGHEGNADAEVQAIAEWICANSRRVERGDRSIQWAKLKSILAKYGCKFEASGGKGNRINISRAVKNGFFRNKPLRTQVYWPGNDGADAPENTVAKIRKDLRLDEAHGIDSRAFYDEKDVNIVSDIIIQHQRVLRRLAKV